MIKSVTSPKANAAKVTLSKEVSGASGYQIQYANNKKFTKGKKKLSVSKSKAFRIIKKLKKKIRYIKKNRKILLHQYL